MLEAERVALDHADIMMINWLLMPSGWRGLKGIERVSIRLIFTIGGPPSQIRMQRCIIIMAEARCTMWVLFLRIHIILLLLLLSLIFHFSYLNWNILIIVSILIVLHLVLMKQILIDSWTLVSSRLGFFEISTFLADWARTVLWVSLPVGRLLVYLLQNELLSMVTSYCSLFSLLKHSDATF